MSRQALGKGLRALIPESEFAGEGREGVVQIPVNQIDPNPFQPRRQFSEVLLQELAESIKTHGILEPLVVRPARRENGMRYELVIGERRWRAAQLVGMEAVPALVRPVGDREMVQMALVENLQREDLNPLEQAEAYRRLVEEFQLSQEAVAAMVGRKRPTVANTLRLLELEPPIKEQILAGDLSEGHAKALLGMPPGAERVRLAQMVVERGWSVRQTEAMVRRALREGASGERARRAAQGAGSWAEMEMALQRALGTRVVIRQGRRKGRIEIEFYGQEELVRLLELLGRLEGVEEGTG